MTQAVETTMLHKMEPTIRRMEYRIAYAPEPLTVLPKIGAPEESSPEVEDKEANDEFLKLAERFRALEQQFSERESEFTHQLEAARKEAYERGRSEEVSSYKATTEKIAQSLGNTLKEFVSVRDAYLAQVEQEVVRLALSIAARILHREAQMDALLLSGAVRVALGQLSDTTEVRLRVPESEYELWGEMVRLMPNLPLRPQLISDENLSTGECALETHLGSVDLGVKAQLAEIERGFFDLLERREPVRRDELRTEAKPEEV
jgi:flagellar assembly protein FliH